MSWRRLRTLMRREVQATFRDPFMVGTMILVPLLSLLVFGFVLSTEVQGLGLGVLDAARSPSSRRVLADLGSQGHFRIREFDTRAALDTATVDGEISVAIVIPPDFDHDLGGGSTAEIQVIYDGAEVVLAGNAEGFLESIVAASVREIATGTAAAAAPGGVAISTSALFNPTLDGRAYMVSGTFGFALTFLTTMLTAVAIVTERVNGTFEQLQVTPATSLEILGGKILPLGAIFAFDVLVMVVAAGLVIGVWPNGNVLFFLLVSSFYVLISLSFGILISATAATTGEAVQKSVLFSFPLTMLSGFVFPIRNMPELIQWIAEIFPATHYIRFSRAVYIRGAGLADVWQELAILAFLGFALLIRSKRAIEARM